MDPETALKNRLPEPSSTRSPEYRIVTGAGGTFLPSYLNADNSKRSRERKQARRKNGPSGSQDTRVLPPVSRLPCTARGLGPPVTQRPNRCICQGQRGHLPNGSNSAPSRVRDHFQWSQRSLSVFHACSVLPATDTWIFPSIPAEEEMPVGASNPGHPRSLPGLPPSSWTKPFPGHCSKAWREGRNHTFPSLIIPFNQTVKPEG